MVGGRSDLAAGHSHNGTAPTLMVSRVYRDRCGAGSDGNYAVRIADRLLLFLIS